MSPPEKTMPLGALGHPRSPFHASDTLERVSRCSHDPEWPLWSTEKRGRAYGDGETVLGVRASLAESRARPRRPSAGCPGFKLAAHAVGLRLANEPSARRSLHFSLRGIISIGALIASRCASAKLGGGGVMLWPYSLQRSQRCEPKPSHARGGPDAKHHP